MGIDVWIDVSTGGLHATESIRSERNENKQLDFQRIVEHRKRSEELEFELHEMGRSWRTSSDTAELGGGMAEPVIWLELVKVGGTLIAASVAAWVAYRIGSSQRDIARQQAETASEQKRIAAAKLNLELFEERYAVFEKVWGFLSAHIIISGDEEVHRILPGDFNNMIPKAQFLFGKKTANYMREIATNHVKLAATRNAVRHRADIATPEQSATITELEDWFYTEASECFKRFADYLDFSTWKADPLDRLLNVDAAPSVSLR